MGCPYSDEELQKWDSVTNPMGPACSDCEDYDCEHNPNVEGADSENYVDTQDFDPNEND